MGAAPDTGGAKNAIQARASAQTYLQRYTLKAITGLSEQDDDDDGRGSGRPDEVQAMVDEFKKQIAEASTEQAARDIWKIAAPALRATKDTSAFKEVKEKVEGKIADFKAAEAS